MNKSQIAPCIVCGTRLDMRPTQGKSGKPGITFICPQDARHFRAFVTDKNFVAGVIDLLEARNKLNKTEAVLDGGPDGERRNGIKRKGASEGQSGQRQRKASSKRRKKDNDGAQ